MDLTVAVYQFTKSLPIEEKFGLQSQARRAAVSVASNIAEGKGRWHTKEFLHSLSVSRGSLLELETQLELMVRLEYKARDECKGLAEHSAELGRMISGLMRSLRNLRPTKALRAES